MRKILSFNENIHKNIKWPKFLHCLRGLQSLKQAVGSLREFGHFNQFFPLAAPSSGRNFQQRFLARRADAGSDADETNRSFARILRWAVMAKRWASSRMLSGKAQELRGSSAAGRDRA